jgi:hypothetical protein
VADETRHGINHAISFRCDYCATTRRKYDVACWHNRELHISTVVEAEGVCGSVRDTGHGLHPEGLPRLVEPFHTTEPDGIGHGPLDLPVDHPSPWWAANFASQIEHKIAQGRPVSGDELLDAIEQSQTHSLPAQRRFRYPDTSRCHSNSC